ncbi:hypothetical protein TNCV_670211 [Trichonephila clavipes]|nr:hypothetical protein TNCV_670211 [Trichonephila clavipes]
MFFWKFNALQYFILLYESRCKSENAAIIFSRTTLDVSGKWNASVPSISYLDCRCGLKWVGLAGRESPDWLLDRGKGKVWLLIDVGRIFAHGFKIRATLTKNGITLSS